MRSPVCPFPRPNLMLGGSGENCCNWMSFVILTQCVTNIYRNNRCVRVWASEGELGWGGCNAVCPRRCNLRCCARTGWRVRGKGFWLELGNVAVIGLLYLCATRNSRGTNSMNFTNYSWPRGLRRGSAAARLLRLWVRVSPGAWMCVVSVVCCQVEVSATG